MAFSDATVDCNPSERNDCWSVSPAFLKEHSVIFDQLIRTKAALKVCQEKK